MRKIVAVLALQLALSMILSSVPYAVMAGAACEGSGTAACTCALGCYASCCTIPYGFTCGGDHPRCDKKSCSSFSTQSTCGNCGCSWDECDSDADCGTSTACAKWKCNNPSSSSSTCTLDTSCDDGNACTADSCHEGQYCTHTTRDCDDNNVCTNDDCNTATGACTHVNNAGDCGKCCKCSGGAKTYDSSQDSDCGACWECSGIEVCSQTTDCTSCGSSKFCQSGLCTTPSGESNCNDNVDNDCDGLKDCFDPNCAGTASCLGQNPCDYGNEAGNYLKDTPSTCTQTPALCDASTCCYGTMHEFTPQGSVYTYCCYASKDTTYPLDCSAPTCADKHLRSAIPGAYECGSNGWQCKYDTPGVPVACCNDNDCQSAGAYCAGWGHRYSKCDTTTHTCSICGQCISSSDCASDSCCDAISGIGGTGICRASVYKYSSKWLCV